MESPEAQKATGAHPDMPWSVFDDRRYVRSEAAAKQLVYLLIYIGP